MKWKLKTQIDKGCELFSFWQDEQFKYKCSHSLRYILMSMSAKRRKDFCLKWVTNVIIYKGLADHSELNWI